MNCRSRCRFSQKKKNIFSFSYFFSLFYCNHVFFGRNICSLTLQWIFLYYSVLLFFRKQLFTHDMNLILAERQQLCMIGCIAVLSHSHRHAFDLSPASKVLSKHCKESLSKCSPLAHFSSTETSYSAKGSSKYLFFHRGRLECTAK